MIPRPGDAPRDLKSVPDPGGSTLRDAIEACNDNVFEAARHEQKALEYFRSLDPNDKREVAARGWILQSRAEKDHWRGYLTAYQIHADVHPELLDLPIGTRCKHGPDCLIGNPNRAARVDREPGSDDDVESPAPDRRLPPEQDQLTF